MFSARLRRFRLSGGFMKRETILAIALTALLTAVPVMFAQDHDDDDQGRPTPPAPSDVIGTQLVAWSQLQEPQPVSARALPSDQTRPPQPNQQSVQTANSSSSKERAPAADSSVSQNARDPKK
jgi:hypothetical protein